MCNTYPNVCLICFTSIPRAHHGNVNDGIYEINKILMIGCQDSLPVHVGSIY